MANDNTPTASNGYRNNANAANGDAKGRFLIWQSAVSTHEFVANVSFLKRKLSGCNYSNSPKEFFVVCGGEQIRWPSSRCKVARLLVGTMKQQLPIFHFNDFYDKYFIRLYSGVLVQRFCPASVFAAAGGNDDGLPPFFR
jgi:hypothetical protein